MSMRQLRLKGGGDMKMHPSVTLNRVMKAVMRHNSSLDNPGICIVCGEDAEDCEPDARKYKCEACDNFGVYGAEELLLMMA